MKGRDIVESWLWGDPCVIIEPLMRRTEKEESKAAVKEAARAAPRPIVARDRYYTRARRLHVKQLMRGKGC